MLISKRHFAENNGDVNDLEFCSDCGTMLRKKGNGMWCPKCRRLRPMKGATAVETTEKNTSNAIYVLDSEDDSVRKAARTCPACGNEEAYQWFSSISGEHAGVKGERTVEHYRCTKCAHTWSESH
jgi:DNA-directed RNA polymerase subunit M/transcription elongation factor TFIIS